jgi:hypothetical protein
VNTLVACNGVIEAAVFIYGPKPSLLGSSQDVSGKVSCDDK